MVNVLILGANGQLARNTARLFLARTDARLTLYLRRARRLENPDPRRVRIVEGDVLEARTLQDAMRGKDVVYANLARSLSRFRRGDRGVDLDYTVLRPGWFTHDEEIDYQLTQKGEPFKGHDVSLNSVSDLIVKLALSPTLEVRRSLGVSRG